VERRDPLGGFAGQQRGDWISAVEVWGLVRCSRFLDNRANHEATVARSSPRDTCAATTSRSRRPVRLPLLILALRARRRISSSGSIAAKASAVTPGFGVPSLSGTK